MGLRKGLLHYVIHVTQNLVQISPSLKWRTLRYGDENGHGEGGREQFKAWLASK